MSQFIVRRLMVFFPMMFVMSLMAFAIIEAPPGDFVDDYLLELELAGEAATAGQARAMRLQLGLDKPKYVQYYLWVRGVVTWDLGMSLNFRRSVNELVNERLVMTVVLGVLTILCTWTLAIPIGIISAVKQYSIVDYVFTFMSYIGVGTPNFMLALIIMWTALATINLSVTGLFSYDYVDAPWSVGRAVDLLKHIWVPMLILGTDGTARFTRIVRANLLDEMNKPYVETARAKGLSEWKLILKYPGAHSPQSLHQHGRLGAARALLGQPDRCHGHEPADDRAPAASVPAQPGHAHGRLHHPHPDRADPHRNPHIGHPPGVDRSPDSHGYLGHGH